MTITPLAPNFSSTVQVPDALGRFGRFGGKYVPETLMPALAELETAYQQYRHESGFQSQLQELLRDYVGRMTPLYFAERLTEYYARPDGTVTNLFKARRFKSYWRS